MDRFEVVYRLKSDRAGAEAMARDICFEQTVEFPPELLPGGFIKDVVVGRIESFGESGDSYTAVVSYPSGNAAGELTQLLNVLFGNISIKPGYRIQDIRLPESMLDEYTGPRFGRDGLRSILNVMERPLLFTALKPMGLSAAELAGLAYKLALGGIDIIKDDHGLTDQPYAPFRERVARCADAVNRANMETGGKSIYMANVTAPYDEIMERSSAAKGYGAGGLLVAPGITGFDAMKTIASDDRIGLPVFSHPAFLGSFVTSPDSGISHYALFGKINRLSGADGTVYPNYGGRFSFSREECADIVRGCVTPMGRIKPIFPCPGGGMTMESIPDMLEVYGRDVVFLVGGGLFRHGPDLVENCRYFLGLVDGRD